MPEEASPAPKTAAGSGFKIALIIVIVILLIGLGIAVYLLMPEQIPELKNYLWPPDGEKPLELSVTLSDGSNHLISDIRFLTNPQDLKKNGAAIQEEFNSKRAIILDILTETANSLDGSTALNSQEFQRRVIRKMNEELKNCQIDRVLISGWMLQPVE